MQAGITLLEQTKKLDLVYFFMCLSWMKEYSSKDSLAGNGALTKNSSKMDLEIQQNAPGAKR